MSAVEIDARDAVRLRRRPGFFLPVRVLSRFRRLFLKRLRAAFNDASIA
jgi:hypothetical protein